MLKKFLGLLVLASAMIALGGNVAYADAPIATIVAYTISNIIISPNNVTSVGILDSTSIDIRFSSEVTDVSMDIIDGLSGQVKHLYDATNVTNPTPKIWNGKNDADSFVADGVYTVQIVYADAGGVATDTSKIITVDNTSPVITLLGPATVNLIVGDSYADAGATALDDVDGDITSSIVTVNPVNAALVGTYLITYNVSDVATNIAIEVTRTVNVAAPTTPVVEPINSNHPSGYILGWGPNGQIGGVTGKVLGASTSKAKELARQRKIRQIKKEWYDLAIKLYDLGHSQTDLVTTPAPVVKREATSTITPITPTATEFAPTTTDLNPTTTASTGSTLSTSSGQASSPQATPTKPFWKFW